VGLDAIVGMFKYNKTLQQFKMVNNRLFDSKPSNESDMNRTLNKYLACGGNRNVLSI